ncbi:MAG: ferritin-like domain-containing protein [Candidatus Nanopelagicaceae bacterium]|nr:ferritin-like domain-containing protein [Candidatus Nanopelagicaceae bacterium]
MVDFVNPFKHKQPGEELTKQEIISAVRLALCAEEEAVHLYDTIAEYVADEAVKKLMTDIAGEEQVHIGEIQKLLKNLEEDEEEKLAQGEKEAEDKIGGGSTSETPAEAPEKEDEKEEGQEEGNEENDIESIAQSMGDN